MAEDYHSRDFHHLFTPEQLELLHEVQLQYGDPSQSIWTDRKEKFVDLVFERANRPEDTCGLAVITAIGVHVLSLEEFQKLWEFLKTYPSD